MPDLLQDRRIHLVESLALLLFRGRVVSSLRFILLLSGPQKALFVLTSQLLQAGCQNCANKRGLLFAVVLDPLQALEVLLALLFLSAKSLAHQLHERPVILPFFDSLGVFVLLLEVEDLEVALSVLNLGQFVPLPSALLLLVVLGHLCPHKLPLLSLQPSVILALLLKHFLALKDCHFRLVADLF